MSKYKPTYKPFGKSTILMEWPSKMEEEIIRDIVAFEKSIERSRGILDTMITYNALTIRYDYEIDFDAEVDELSDLYKVKKKHEYRGLKCWQIPVCYDLDFGIDLCEIASAKELSVEEVIQFHSAPDYLIYFIGFQPGFLYLGGLNEKIHVPRKADPRLQVAKGSVGIGGSQTGVYPNDSAGGWNILGRSPIDFFDISKPQPCFARAGDRIQFRPIDKGTYYQIMGEEQDGNYKHKFHAI